MEITSVRVHKLERENSRLRAIATIIIDDAFMIHDIKILQGDNGLFCAMPSRQLSDKTYRDIAHPISSEVRQYMEKEIIQVYNETAESEDE